MRMMAAAEQNTRSSAAIGERAGNRRSCRKSRSYSRHNFKFQPGCTKCFDLFGSPPEDHRIAAFQSRYAERAAGAVNHQLVNAGLGNALAPAALANVDDAGSRVDEREHRGWDEVVMQHHVD